LYELRVIVQIDLHIGLNGLRLLTLTRGDIVAYGVSTFVTKPAQDVVKKVSVCVRRPPDLFV